MNASKIRRFALPVAGALAVAAAAVAVTASAAGVTFGVKSTAPTAASGASGATGSSPSIPGRADIAAYCSTFMQNFAADLGHGASADTVEAAARKAIGQTIDKAVSDGKLTADQAAKAKAAIPAGSLCAAASALPVPPGGPGAGPGLGRPAGADKGLGAYLPAYLDAAAKAAGLGSAADLKTALAGGQSLQAVAQAHGVDEATFRKNLITNLTPTVDAAVASGKLTADQEKALLARLQTNPLPMWKGHATRPNPPTPPAGAAPPAA